MILIDIQEVTIETEYLAQAPLPKLLTINYPGIVEEVNRF